MISPTGKKARTRDKWGGGCYLAKRGNNRLHDGTDYICTPGQDIVSPIAGRIERIANPYANEKYSGLLIQGEWMAIKLFYFKPDKELIGKTIDKGQKIGIAQDISEKYPDMTPHIHLTIISINPEIFITYL